MKYKLGDRVRVDPERTVDMNDKGKMDKWLGKIMTIKSVGTEHERPYKMLEDSEEYEGDGWFWGDHMLAGLASEVTVTIDPTNPRAAHKAVDAAIRAYRIEQQDWTADEVNQAKELSRELVLKLWDADRMVWYSVTGTATTFRACDGGTMDNPQEASCEPHGNDAYNVDIGKCVCLCKLTGTPIPEFIENKNVEGI